ncbi:basic leucine zipper 4-like [Typha latifolia]|uniref:basic leucine zipper 4-like n=1 Tax=Typha latifolia TaxID=4733 RepID=UPI003C2ADE5A
MTMLSFDEALAVPFPFSLPDPDFDFGFGLTPWEIPDAIPTPESDPPCSDEPDRSLSPAEQRRLRRMISNRESARRSRMRKQRRLEELRTQLARLRSENRELTGRVGAVVQRCLLVRRDNDRIRSESAYLRRRLSEARRVLVLRQLHRLMMSSSSGFEQTLASLIA